MDRATAIRILDPETTIEALAEIEYYNGFSGQVAKVQACDEACIIAVADMREQEQREHKTQEIKEKSVDTHGKLMGLLQRAPYIRCEDVHRQYAVNWLINNGVMVQDVTDINDGNKWISVEERLPEDDLPKDTKRLMIRCLVYTDKGTVKPCVRQRWKHFNGQLVPWQWNKDLSAKPTHWRYMPEPPEGGAE